MAEKACPTTLSDENPTALLGTFAEHFRKLSVGLNGGYTIPRFIRYVQPRFSLVIYGKYRRAIARCQRDTRVTKVLRKFFRRDIVHFDSRERKYSADIALTRTGTMPFYLPPASLLHRIIALAYAQNSYFARMSNRPQPASLRHSCVFTVTIDT